MLNQAILSHILVIIPVLNEEATITGVIESLQSLGLQRIRVVDNGSCDQSLTKAQTAGAEVLREPIPGYGRACWRGLQSVPPDIDWIFFCDGDGSDDLTQLPQLLAQLDAYDLVLGNRRATAVGRAAMTAVQNFGNWLATWLIHLGWGYRYHDLGPLRLIRRDALDHIQMQDRGFGWTVEMQVRAVECDLRIAEIPVGYRRRQGGRSKISGTLTGSLQAGTVILSTLGQLYWRRLGVGSWGNRLCLILSSFLLILGCVLIVPYGDFRQVEVIPRFWLGIGVMAVGYLLSWCIKAIKVGWFWAVAIGARLILLLMYPGDDIWRYLWEGYIQQLGFSPYHVAPDAAVLEPYRTAWWSQINHLDVSAIYPPLTQFGFRALAAIVPAVLLFKLAFVIADLLVCGLLSRRFGCTQTLVYAWNPLILYAFAGGGHYDSWFLLPVVAAWLVFEGGGKTIPLRQLGSALLIGISVAIKWMSLPILGFLAWRTILSTTLNRARIMRTGAVLLCGGLPLVLSALPFCTGGECPLVPTDSVFVSHGRSAELIPYVASVVWEPLRWHNWPFLFPLGLVTAGLIVRAQTFAKFAEGYFIALLLLSPIVHIWYFTWLVPFAVVSRNWGTRWVSVSAFVYFALLYRKGLGDFSWHLTVGERMILWLPFLLGWVWTWRQQRRKSLNLGISGV